MRMAEAARMTPTMFNIGCCPSIGSFAARPRVRPARVGAAAALASEIRSHCLGRGDPGFRVLVDRWLSEREAGGGHREEDEHNHMRDELVGLHVHLQSALLT